MRHPFLLSFVFFLVASGLYGDSNNNPPIGERCEPPHSNIENYQAGVISANVPANIFVEEGNTIDILVNYQSRDGTIDIIDIQCDNPFTIKAIVRGVFKDGSTSIYDSISFTAPDVRPNGGVVMLPVPKPEITYKILDQTAQSVVAPSYFVQGNDPRPVSHTSNLGEKMIRMTILQKGIDPRGNRDSEGWEPNSALAGGDSDNDGLDDAWEIHYFGNLDQGSWDDPDEDGLPNVVEANRGFNPTIKTTLMPLYIKEISRYISIDNPNNLDIIHYTLDGAEPTLESPAYFPGNYFPLGSQGEITVRAVLFVGVKSVLRQSQLFKTEAPANAQGVNNSAHWPQPGIIFRGPFGYVTSDSPVDTGSTNEDSLFYGTPSAVVPGPGKTWVPEGGFWHAYAAGARHLWEPTSHVLGWLKYSRKSHYYRWNFTVKGEYYHGSGYSYIYFGDVGYPTDEGIVPANDSRIWYNIEILTPDYEKDTDGDGILDTAEIVYSKTDPNNPDTDGDGLSDLLEATHWFFDPNNPNDASGDFDGDGLTNGEEILAGTDMFASDFDSDRDGLSDEDEINLYGTDPHNPDTDGDGIPDVYEISVGTDPLVAKQELISIDFQRSMRIGRQDTDGDWVPDDYEDRYSHIMDPLVDDGDKDGDGDGVTNWEEWAGGYKPDDMDTDGDGMPDGWENEHNLDPNNPADALLDADGDGLINLLEYQFGSNPRKADSDDDGLSDLQEVYWGTNPAVFDSDQPSHFRSGLSHYWQMQDDGTDTDGDG
ncbi:MAG: chitobiase/beta-hexosaminidase C-terminal domain-containing protein, partial [Opitutaceae bacterium]|nr:chitobiase/beta-hexosaminidase C-terminal domain-containing protein [Opitutaceae bacterium]